MVPFKEKSIKVWYSKAQLLSTASEALGGPLRATVLAAGAGAFGAFAAFAQKNIRALIVTYTMFFRSGVFIIFIV